MKMPNIESVIEDHSTPNALDPCEDFVEATKLYRSTMGIDLPNISRLDRVKELLAASSYATKAWPTQCRIPLDHPCLDEASTMTLSLALRDRVSSKKIEPGTRLSFGDLSYLLWAADGMTHELDNGSTGRTAPSGGALYPRDVYLITRDDAIEKIPRGAWHYNPYEHCLEQVGDQGLEQVFNHQWHREVVVERPEK